MLFCEIHRYAMNGDLENLKKALEIERQKRGLTTIEELIDLRDDNGFTPLLLAASFGCFEVAQFLVEKGADLRAHNNTDDFTPLFFVIYKIERRIENGEGDVENFYRIAQLFLTKDFSLLEAKIYADSPCLSRSIFSLILRSCPEERRRMLEIIREINSEYPGLAELEKKVAEDAEEARKQAELAAADIAAKTQTPPVVVTPPQAQTKLEPVVIPSSTTSAAYPGQQLTQRRVATTAQLPSKKPKQSIGQQSAVPTTYSGILSRFEVFSSRLFSFFTSARHYQAIPSSEDVPKKTP